MNVGNPRATDRGAPRVLAVLVVKDAAPWLRRSLAALARQTHRPLGVVAVDNGSRDGSVELLERALGSGRVIRLHRNAGFAVAVSRALRAPAAAQADYLLFLHDDTALEADAVATLVDGARRVERFGVAGPKVRDWDRPDVLREVGLTADRFAYPALGLEEGEIDQGQHDRARQVLYVSSSAMLVSRDAWEAAGPLEDRIMDPPDLDFCWRVRLAGFRVIVDPRAVAFHRMAGTLGERPGTDHAGTYRTERSGLLSVLKNYRLFTLAWVLPLYVLQGTVRVVVLTVTGRARQAGQVLRAWGWNLTHLGGTLGRRRRAQAKRTIRDREVTRFMASVRTRLRRWGLVASSLLFGRGGRIDVDEEAPSAPLRTRLARVFLGRPVAIALVMGTVFTLVAFREVLFGPPIEGGALPVFPSGPLHLVHAVLSPWRPTGLGGPGGSSPALGVLAAASFVTVGSPPLLARVLVAMAPLAAGISCHRAVVRRTGEQSAGVIAGASYALSALVMWATSGGHVPSIVFLVALPFLAVRAIETWGGRGVDPVRLILGSGLVLALSVSFFPATVVALLFVAAVCLVVPERPSSPARGLVWLGGSLITGAVLLFPFVPVLASSHLGTAVDAVGRADFGALLRLSPGPAKGSWIVSAFLPVAAIVAFALAGDQDRRLAIRSLAGAVTAVTAAWLAAAGYLPAAAANPIAFLGPAAFFLSLLVGLAVRDVVAGAGRYEFGSRQLVFGSLVAVTVVGLLLQSLQALLGGWAVGRDRLPPAWPVVADAAATGSRVLWVGAPGGAAFPPPGGMPDGTVSAGPASVRYAVTGPRGRTVNGIGLSAGGTGYRRLEDVLLAILAGRVRHAGALLSTFGVRFVVSGDTDLPPAAAGRLEDQLDLDLIQSAGGLRVYEAANALPVAAVLGGEGVRDAVTSGQLLAPVEAQGEDVVALAPAGPGAWRGSAGAGTVATVATPFDPGWRLAGGRAPFRAYGWAVGFDVRPGSTVDIEVGGAPVRAAEMGALVLLWIGAGWGTVRRGRRRTGTPEPAPSRTSEPGSDPAPARAGRGR